MRLLVVVTVAPEKLMVTCGQSDALWAVPLYCGSTFKTVYAQTNEPHSTSSSGNARKRSSSQICPNIQPPLSYQVLCLYFQNLLVVLYARPRLEPAFHRCPGGAQERGSLTRRWRSIVSKRRLSLRISTDDAVLDLPEATGETSDPLGAAEEGVPHLDANQLETLTVALVRANRSLDKKKTQLREMREKLADSKQQFEESCEESDELRERLDTMDVQMRQYRNWWLNEVQFTKVILNKVPNANQDWDLVRESQSHYLGRF
jgi:uncharacterized coiled-coil protein SlyX